MNNTPRKRTLTRCETPVVGETLRKRQMSQRSQVSLRRASLNVLFACLLCLELLSGSLTSYFTLTWLQHLIWYSECCLAVCFALSTVVDVYHYVAPFLVTNPILITEKQRTLLAVGKTDVGFKDNGVVISKTPPRVEHVSHSSSSSLGSFTPPSDQSLVITSKTSQSSSHTPKRDGTSPNSFMGHTPVWNTPPRQIGSPLGNRGSTPSYYSDISQKGSSMMARLQQSPSSAFNITNDLHPSSPSKTGHLGSPYSPSTFSPYSDYSPETSFSFTNQGTSSPSLSPRKSIDTADNLITDVSSLNKYLKSCDFESQFQTGSPDNLSSTNGQNAWSMYNRKTDFTLPLSSYRIATRSSQSSHSLDEEEYGHYSSQAEELWSRIGVGRNDLDVWTENCRKWLCKTIMSKLVEQIETINQELSRTGLTEFQIGSASISTLRQVALRKADQIPQLQAIIPYMELSQNQEYLMQRIKELSKGGCLAVYRWNSGGQFRGRPWDQDLPTDAEIVVHTLCTYMDSRLPADPKYLDGRSFTGQHFVRSPSSDKKEAQKSGLILQQQHIHPPHFKVVKDGNVYDVGKGRNNLFHSIVMFLYFVKTEHYGMLGRVNLGLSGVNILCILEKK